MNWSIEIFNGLLKDTNMPVEKVCKAIGLSETAYRNCLDTNGPGIENMVKIADYFAVPLDLLAGRCTEEQENAILEDYSSNFMKLRRAAYEDYLYVSENEKIPDKYEAPYPYNLLDEVFREPVDWMIRDDYVEQALNTLTDKEHMIVYYRYHDGLTLAEIGKKYGVSRERIRQVLLKAVMKLRHPTRKNILQSGFHSFEEIDAYAVKKLAVLDEKEKFLNEFEAKLYKKSDVITENEREQQAVLDALRLAQVHLDAAIRNTSEINFRNAAKCLKHCIPKYTVEELDFTVRAYNCLKRSGVNTLSDILNMGEKELMNVHNIGKKCMDEIIEKVTAMGYSKEDWFAGEYKTSEN